MVKTSSSLYTRHVFNLSSRNLDFAFHGKADLKKKKVSANWIQRQCMSI